MTGGGRIGIWAIVHSPNDGFWQILFCLSMCSLRSHFTEEYIWDI